jgi:hypothetical protein
MNDDDIAKLNEASSPEGMPAPSGLDDPLWAYILRQRLEPYIPYVRRWWDEASELAPFDTGIYAIEYDEEQPAGLFWRFTRTAVRSPIRGVQAFPFLVAGYLQLTGIRGGSTKLVQRVLMDDKFTMDEFMCVEIHNLPSTFNQGQVIAFVPIDTYNDSRLLGKWIYFTNEEISSLIRGEITTAVRNKAIIKG